VWLAPRRMLRPLAVSSLLVSVALRWSVIYGLIPPLNIYTNTLTRLDGLSLGAFLALWIPQADIRVVKWAGVGVLAAAVPLTILIASFHEGHWSFYSLVALSFAGLLCVVINIQRAANLEFLKYSGKIRYCLYLVHVPICSFLTLPQVHKIFLVRSPVWSDAVLFAVAFALCYALAGASWHFFESKIMRLKSRFEFRSAPADSAPATIAASTSSIRP
ncbi:MAG TPA: hypothetical protein VEX69_07450, partial [Candidatus Limnocylindria bacterium]|nr:hypothetical protein [Candidatus Limnocylindria bacterium]